MFMCTIPWYPQTGQPHTGCGGSSVQSADSFLLTPENVQCRSVLTLPLPVTDIYPQPGRLAGKFQTHTTGLPTQQKFKQDKTGQDFNVADTIPSHVVAQCEGPVFRCHWGHLGPSKTYHLYSSCILVLYDQRRKIYMHNMRNKNLRMKNK